MQRATGFSGEEKRREEKRREEKRREENSLGSPNDSSSNARKSRVSRIGGVPLPGWAGLLQELQ